MSDELKSQLTRIERKLDLILREKRKEEKEDEYIGEDQAAAMLNWSPAYLRRKAKGGKIPVMYRSINHRNFRYNRNHIQSLLNKD